MLQEFHFEFISAGRELTRNVQHFSWGLTCVFIVASREICFVVYLMINLLGLWLHHSDAVVLQQMHLVFLFLCCYFQQIPITKGPQQMFPSAHPCILHCKVLFCSCCFSLLTCLLFVNYCSPPPHSQCSTHTSVLTSWFKINYRPVLLALCLLWGGHSHSVKPAASS